MRIAQRTIRASVSCASNKRLLSIALNMRLASILARCSLALFAIACPKLTFARQVSCLQQTVHVNVLTRDGRIVTGLAPSNFVASYRHRPVLIRSVAENREPRRVFILIDASASMRPVHDLSFNVAEELLSDLPPGTQFAFLVFAERAAGAPEFTTDRSALRTRLETLRNERHLQKRIRRMTALLSALQEGLASFGQPHEGDSFYVISDGDDNLSQINWRKLDLEMLHTSIRVFAMRVYWTGTPVSNGDDHLMDLVRSTGGYALVLPLPFDEYDDLVYDRPLTDSHGNPTRLAAEIGLQLRLIMHSMDMAVQLPRPPGKLSNWGLRLADPRNAKSLILTYQHVLPPCHN